MRWDKPRRSYATTDGLAIGLVVFGGIVTLAMVCGDLFVSALSSACIDSCPTLDSAHSGHVVAVVMILLTVATFVLLAWAALGTASRTRGNGSLVAALMLPALVISQVIGSGLGSLMGT